MLIGGVSVKGVEVGSECQNVLKHTAFTPSLPPFFLLLLPPPSSSSVVP